MAASTRSAVSSSNAASVRPRPGQGPCDAEAGKVGELSHGVGGQAVDTAAITSVDAAVAIP